MKLDPNVQERVAYKRYLRKLKSKRKRKHKRRLVYMINVNFKRIFPQKKIYITDVMDKWLPPTLSYLLTEEKSPFNLVELTVNIVPGPGKFDVPENFSIVNEPTKSFRFLKQITAALIFQTHKTITINYQYCTNVDLGAQVLLDIILKDIMRFYKKCRRYQKIAPIVKTIEGKRVNKHINKMLFSVGSPSSLLNSTYNFPDIIPYKLCIHDKEQNRDPLTIRKQKDIDTSRLIDYVVNSLDRLNRTLTSASLENLSTVIGEVLINAEEHSSTKDRFSIGYFQEMKHDGKHYGVFRIAILNFGKTIYEKFKDPHCPNKQIVEKMRALSEKYTTSNFFQNKKFEEETLWTLYALQDGVTSVAPGKYKRGNGSMHFIESFFNLRGKSHDEDKISKMVLMSGNAKIMFDGTYETTKSIVKGEEFTQMTFNNTGTIEDKPDPKYVNFVEDYFPGTIISAKILFTKDDLIEQSI